MEIVINISDKDYQLMKDGHIPFNILDKMMNGTPLPKGHGRLIECERLQEVFRRNVVGYAGFKKLFDNAPTIIGADKESEDNK